ncbi:hypothetical protein [Sphingopyxis sp.]|uniref:hypothetical protein n=1 Tax=Sphingopyxis sp. TaxID=1908224 RepID=UPI001DC5C688|nr:hypothetical protein [Sphingopyxis sp.]MBW8296381.1 hypothetical protein [Sphingopyxis sp.]
MSDSNPRDPLDDARPDSQPRAPAPGSLPQQKVEDRENVGTATPEDYPERDRKDGDITAARNRGKRANKQGSGPVTGSGAGAGGGGNPEDYDDDAQGGGGHMPSAADHGPKTGADAPVGGSR